MKKSLLILIAFLFATNAFAQGPVIKFYQFDGTNDSYSFDDIESISFANPSESLLLKIYQKNQAVQNFPAKSIDSLRYGLDNVNRQVIRFSSFGIPRTFILSNVDSIVFKPLKIGNRIWMTTNLNVDHYRNGDSIPEVRDPAAWEACGQGAWCYYNNDPALGAIYGKLYNRAATLDPRGLAPEGWLIPEHDDWGDSIYTRNLKSTGTFSVGDGFWAYPNDGATNESGFTALPGGIRSQDGSFKDLGKSGNWGKFEFDYNYKDLVYYSMHQLNSQSPDLKKIDILTPYSSLHNYGFSVRCFKYVVPPSIKSINHDTISAGDTITIIGENFGSEKRSGIVLFNFKAPSKYLSWNDSIICVIAPTGITNGKLFIRIGDELTNQIEYFVGLWSYDTVRIGNQTWMTKNLNTDHYRNGDPIPNSDPSTWDGITTGAWCYYNNDPANEGIYAKLYNSHAVNDPRGLAPLGWHVATDEDWAELGNCLGGDSVAAGKLKTTGTIEGGDGLWYSPNSGATNEIGFSALPGGCCGSFESDEYPYYFNFTNIGNVGAWWSVSPANSSLLTVKFMRLDSAGIMHYNYYSQSNTGLSVRCVKGNPRPQIISINNEMLNLGDTITIKGSAFGFQRESNHVNINDLTISDYVSWGDTEIKTIIPPTATSGKLWVTVGGSNSNEMLVNIGNSGDKDSLKRCTVIWMKMNLDVDHYRNGDSIPQVTDPAQLNNLTTGAWCYYNNDPANDSIYGKLYNWYALNDPRGLAPEGWHLPTNEEWEALGYCLGGLNVAGGKLKATGTLEDGNGLWAAPNTGATNQSGFSAIPGGMMNTLHTTWHGIGTDAVWWSMTESHPGELPLAWFWGLSNTSSGLYKMDHYKANAYYVRCVRNAVPPSINSVNPQSGTIGDTVTIFGENFGDLQGISVVTFNDTEVYKYFSWSDTVITVRIPYGAMGGNIKVRVNGVWSEDFNYTLNPVLPVSIQIGNQVWMTSNLNVDHYRNGDPIPEAQDITQWCSLTTGAWCYYNNDSGVGAAYGKLYNWYAVNDPRGLAPEGWHIPSDAEWTVLSNSLGGESVAGGKLKESGTAHWSFPNTEATNESYFSALPGGALLCRPDGVPDKGLFFVIGLSGYWWTASENDALNARYRSMMNNDKCIKNNILTKSHGFSVRCVKD